MTDDETRVHQPRRGGWAPGSGEGAEPHQDYLRQAAAHFNRSTPTTAQPPPAIFRSSQPTPQPPSTGHPQPRIFRNDPVADPVTTPLTEPLQVQPPPANPVPWQVPAMPQAPSPASAGAGRDLRPEHLLWALTAFSGLATLTSGVAWIVFVGVCAYFAWVARTRPILWSPDVEELLVQYRLAQPTGRSMGAPGAAGQRLAYIPFRPLTFGEMLGAALKIVARNWAALIAVPAVLFTAIFTLAWAFGFVLFQLTMAGAAPSGLVMEGLYSLCAGVVGVVFLPASAFTIAWQVTIIDKAIRGENVRLPDFLALAKRRTRKLIGLLVVFLVFSACLEAISYGVLVAGPAAYFLLLPLRAVDTVVAFVFAFAVIVLLLEERGAVESIKRAWAVVKQSWRRLLGVYALCAGIAALLLFLAVAITVATVMVGFGIAGAIFFGLGFAVAVPYVTALDVLIYTDLRIRQERYDVELGAAWARNTGAA